MSSALPPTGDQDQTLAGGAGPIRIHTWAGDSRFMAIPEVMPMVRPFITNAGRSPEWYAQQAFDQIASRVVAKAALGQVYGDYTIFPQNIANRGISSGNTDSPNIMAHPDDRANDGVNPAIKGPFTANGQAEGRAWTLAFATHLRGLLEAAGYPWPASAHLDVEGGSLLDFDGLPSPTGWFFAALGDPRADTELIDGTRTLNEFVGSYWTAVQGEPYAFGPNTTTSFFNQNSTGRRNGTRLLTAIAYSVQAWSLWKGFIEPMVEVFPTIREWSNYANWGLAQYDVRAFDRAKAWDHRYGVANDSMTHQAAVLYPSQGSAWQGSGSAREDHAANSGVTLTGDAAADFSELSFARARNVVRLLKAEGKKSIFWINHPGETWVLNSTQWPPSGYTHTTTEEDITRIARMCAVEGFRQMFFWQNTGAMTSQQIDANARAMRAFIAQCRAMERTQQFRGRGRGRIAGS